MYDRIFMLFKKDSLLSMKQKKKEAFPIIIVFFGIILVHLIISIFTGKWVFSDNPYNSYTLQALSWLEGRLDLGRNYEYLELAAYGGKYYVSFPPFPSYLLLPFAFLFGEQTPDGWISLAVCLMGAWFAYKIGIKLLKDQRKAVFWTLFLYTGTNILFLTLDGWVWFFAQNLCLTLSFMTLYFAIEGKLTRSLCCFAMSIGCRPFQAIYFPALCYLFFIKKRKIKDLIVPMIAAGSIGISYMVLNDLRFGSVWEFGHNYLKEFLEAKNGQFSFRYMKENIDCLFRLPYFTGDLKIHFYEFNGTAFWLVSPVFLSAIILIIQSLYRWKHQDKQNKTLHFILAGSIILHIIWFTAHKTMGGWHFGNRYPVDTIPYLYFIICCILLNKSIKMNNMVHIVLCICGVFINVIGTIIFYL